MQEGSEHWDIPLTSLSAGWRPLTLYLIAALDERFAWPPVIGWAGQAFEVVLLVSGSGLVLAAMAASRFFSAVVRIQADRGQVVVRRSGRGEVRAVPVGPPSGLPGDCPSLPWGGADA